MKNLVEICSVEKILTNEKATKNEARNLASLCYPALVVGFSGPIGAGKTTFIRFFLQALGITENIKSPTYSLIESYKYAAGSIHHFDLYRLTTPDELEYLGYKEFFTDKTICCIEWPEHALDYLPNIDLHYHFKVIGKMRKLIIVAGTVKGQIILQNL